MNKYIFTRHIVADKTISFLCAEPADKYEKTGYTSTEIKYEFIHMEKVLMIGSELINLEVQLVLVACLAMTK